MPSAFLKQVATLLLAIVCAHFGHLLAEGLATEAFGDHGSYSCLVSVNDDLESDGNREHRHHGHEMACDQWLCSGFSGVILGTDAIIAKTLKNGAEPYFRTKGKKIPGRTIKPQPNPPRA
jgi:hypothetical protein